MAVRNIASNRASASSRASASGRASGVWRNEVGLVMYLPMNDNAANTTVADLTSYKNTGTFDDATGNPNTSAHSTTGQVGNALSFDGTDDYITIDSVLTVLSTNTQGTITGWAKLTDSTPTTLNMLVAFGDTDVAEYLRIRVELDGTITVDCFDAMIAQWVFTTDAKLIFDDTFFHFALVQNGTAPVFYINGSLAAITFSVSTDKTDWFATLTGIDNGRIGCRNTNNLGNGLFLTGLMDEVHIYNRALDAQEIKQHYLAGL